MSRWSHLPPELRAWPLYIRRVQGSSIHELKHAKEALLGHPEFILEAMQVASRNGESPDGALQYVTEPFRNDAEALLKCASHCSMKSIFEAASKELQSSKDFCWATMRADFKGVGILPWAGDELRGDRDFILDIIEQKSGDFFRFASDELRKDRETVLAAVRLSGLALEFASPRLTNDREVVMAAVRQSGSALQFVFERLRGDRDVVFAALQQTGLVLQHASEELRADRDLVLTAVRSWGFALQDAPATLRGDPEIVLAAVGASAGPFRFATDELKRDRDLVMKVVARQGEALQYAHADLRADREVVLLAVQQYGRALRHGSQELRNDPTLLHTAVLTYPEAVRDVGYPLRDNPVAMLEAGRRGGLIISYVSHKLSGDRDFLLEAMRTPGGSKCNAFEDIKDFANSKVAHRGEEGAPTAIVVARQSTKYSSTSEYPIECEINFPSGRAMECTMNEEAAVNDLATFLVEHRPTDMQAFDRLHLIFDGCADFDNCDEDEDVGASVSISVWDCKRPLKNYLKLCCP
mmetsp:Transcript_6331/g.13700  ORF Transcript_6331/g.13700 Transcript_6331/m.13700 type:complete len:523 (+) Transcript_6331:96-1664(+)